MGVIFDLTLPTSWSELKKEQLSMIFNLFARNLSAEEVKTLCLIKWNNIRVIKEQPKHHFHVKRGKVQVVLTGKQIQAATATLDFLDTVPAHPVRIEKLGRHQALPATLEGVPFEKYLYLDNLFQGVLLQGADKGNTIQSNPLLLTMTQILYDTDKKNIPVPYIVGTFYWWASLKQYLARLYPHFFQPINAESDNLLSGKMSLFDNLREATNAQIRALTGGDITKEALIKKMDTHRALTELDAKAHEAEELRKQYK